MANTDTTTQAPPDDVAPPFDPGKPSVDWSPPAAASAANDAAPPFDPSKPSTDWSPPGDQPPPSYLGGIKDAFTSAAATVNESLNPFSQSYKDAEQQRTQSGNPLSSMASVGKGVAAIPQMVAGPAMKAIAPPITDLMTKAEQSAGEFIAKALNPNPKLPTQNQVYNATEPGVETALGLAMPGKVKSLPVPPAPTPGAFGITKSAGEAAGDLGMRQAEQEAIRQGTPHTQAWEAQRAAQLDAAKDQITAGFDPSGQQLASTPGEAGNLLQQGLQRTEASRKATVDLVVHSKARAQPGEIHASSFAEYAK